ncbi:hypothetical protein BJX62DRAFT_232703 [Aspergillus germanicus]
MSCINNSHGDHGQGPEARLRWERRLLGLDDEFEGPDAHSDHEGEHDDTVDSENGDDHDHSQDHDEDPYQDPTPLHEPETPDTDDGTRIEVQRALEPTLTSAFMPNHHGELYLMYRWTSTFITVPVCIWVQLSSDMYAFRGATIQDLRAHVPVPEAGDIVRGFWVRPHDDLLMVGWGRVVDVVYDQEIYLADFVSR